VSFNNPSLGVIVCEHVFEKKRNILYVYHGSNGWQFMCGELDHQGASGINVGVRHLISRDHSLHELSDLPIGWQAERVSIESNWKKSPVEE